MLAGERSPQDFVPLGPAARWLCCPQCHGDLHFDAARLRCEACQARYPVVDGIPVFVNPSESQSVEYRLREQVAGEWQGKAPEEILRKLRKHHLLASMENRARSFAAAIEQGVIVDIGAGWGWHWRSYRGLRPVVAVDFSLANCRLAASTFLRDNPFVQVVCADATRLPVREAAGIWSVQTFQHFPPAVMAAVLEECRRLARPHGLRAEIINQHPVPFVRAIYWVFRRPYLMCGRNQRFFLHRRRAQELVDLFRPIARGIEVSYSELFFHPDILLRWNRLYPQRLEEALSESALARYIARQIHMRFEIPSGGSLE